jgi:hypothetical protein
MKLSATGLLAIALAFLPLVASAHEEQQFRINGTTYEFVVGSVNEPIAVDDKTGVELSVRLAGMGGQDNHAAGAVAGLEESLEVEIIAGGEKKVLPLSPTYGVPGSYRAPFYPTAPTTYSYRFFGMVNDTPIDLTFACTPRGHAKAEEDTTEVEMSEGVTRVMKSGSFGCPLPKEELSFPKQSKANVALGDDVALAQGLSAAALILSLIATGYAASRKK